MKFWEIQKESITMHRASAIFSKARPIR